MATAKYKVGDHVNHLADPAGAFPAGIGVVTAVGTTDPVTYKVKCDATKKVLPVDLKEADLTLVT